MKCSIDFKEFDTLIDSLKKVGGDVEKTTEKALEKSHDYITPLIEDKVQSSNLPAHGKYAMSGEHLRNLIIRDKNITWEGSKCSIDVGFDLRKSIVPIFMIRGTEKMNAVKGLKNTLEGKSTQDKISEIQENVFMEEITKKYGG